VFSDEHRAERTRRSALPPRAVVEQARQPVRQTGEDQRRDELSVGVDGEASRRVEQAVFGKGTDRPGVLSPQRARTQRSALPPPGWWGLQRLWGDVGPAVARTEPRPPGMFVAGRDAVGGNGRVSDRRRGSGVKAKFVLV
jgi:hypothetical protein